MLVSPAFAQDAAAAGGTHDSRLASLLERLDTALGDDGRLI